MLVRAGSEARDPRGPAAEPLADQRGVGEEEDEPDVRRIGAEEHRDQEEQGPGDGDQPGAGAPAGEQAAAGQAGRAMIRRRDGDASDLAAQGTEQAWLLELAALLLDNEALPRDYGTATAEDILDGHVRPYGIAVAPGYALPAVNRFFDGQAQMGRA